MTNRKVLYNYINNQWMPASGSDTSDVIDPATGKVLSQIPYSTALDVDYAVQAAQKALVEWRDIPIGERVQFLFTIKGLLEENIQDLVISISTESGKTLAEAHQEIRAGIENIESACGMPLLFQGFDAKGLDSKIDQSMHREAVGVSASITPFNYPALAPCWYFPYALACGNTFIIKPSEKTPITIQKIFEIIENAGLPRGVLNLLHGGNQAVDALLDHPLIRAVSFAGATPIAKYIYNRATLNGKRVQCQGSSKNPVVILADADKDITLRTITESAFGCAGQSSMAFSQAIPVGKVKDWFVEAISEMASNRVVGCGLRENTQMGPVISPKRKNSIETAISNFETNGAKIVVDGRNTQISGYEHGYFVRPTIIVTPKPTEETQNMEIFGPVLTITPANDLDEALQIVNHRNFGHTAALFTTSGSDARKFKYEAEAGNICINVALNAPSATFQNSAWKESFFGDIHALGVDSVEFFTQKKVVLEHWH